MCVCRINTYIYILYLYTYINTYLYIYIYKYLPRRGNFDMAFEFMRTSSKELSAPYFWTNLKTPFCYILYTVLYIVHTCTPARTQFCKYSIKQSESGFGKVTAPWEWINLWSGEFLLTFTLKVAVENFKKAQRHFSFYFSFKHMYYF
jgi:hypothetical protein